MINSSVQNNDTGLSNISHSNINSKKIRVHAGLLTTKCYLKLKWNLFQIPETLYFAHHDDSPHNMNRDKLAYVFESKGFKVKPEPWLSYEFEEFILSHSIDLYVENDNTKAYIEVKSKFHHRYKHQFQAAMLLIAMNNPEAEYWVYGYRNNTLTPQVLIKPEKFRKRLEKKISKILNKRVYPYYNKHCENCGYGQCRRNPNHKLISQEYFTLSSEFNSGNDTLINKM